MRNTRSNGKYNFLAVSTLFFLVCGAPLRGFRIILFSFSSTKVRFKMTNESWFMKNSRDRADRVIDS